MQIGTHNSTKLSSSSPEPRRPRRRRRPHRVKHANVRREVSAGGVIYRKRNGVVEFFFIRDPYGKWTFPKGHQELGETLAETAIREIREETGLTNLAYIAPLGRTSFRFRREKNVIEKTVTLFLFEASADAKEDLPGTEGITKAAWFRADKARSMSGYRNLDRLFVRALTMTGVQVVDQGRRQNFHQDSNDKDGVI